MPRFIVPPKYKYTQSHGTTYLPWTGSTSGTGPKTWVNQRMFPYAATFDTETVLSNYPSIIMPEMPTISRGNGTDERTHSKITVTNVRWKFSMQLNIEMLNRGSWLPLNVLEGVTSSTFDYFPYAADYTGTTGDIIYRPIQWPPNPGMLYKFRYFMVEFDEDIAINIPKIYNWFFSTYCQFRDQRTTPFAPLPNVAVTPNNLVPAPISVHSNVMRMTTPWTGKFKILADRCFVLTANRPRVSIDVTIPVNRVFTYGDDWQYQTLPENTVLTPHIYCFILPPLSMEQDVGAVDAHLTEEAVVSDSHPTSSMNYIPFIDWTSWMKFNFVDI